jgi:hypothetical protein
MSPSIIKTWTKLTCIFLAGEIAFESGDTSWKQRAAFSIMRGSSHEFTSNHYGQAQSLSVEKRLLDVDVRTLRRLRWL